MYEFLLLERNNRGSLDSLQHNLVRIKTQEKSKNPKLFGFGKYGRSNDWINSQVRLRCMDVDGETTQSVRRITIEVIGKSFRLITPDALR